MIKPPLIYWIFVVLPLSACSLDREYSLKQPVNIPQTWSTHDRYVTQPMTDARCFAWWLQYHDRSLNKLIALGLKRNNDIQMAMANIEAAEGELKHVELNWLPNLAVNLGYSSFPYLGFPGVLATLAIPLYTVNIFNQIKSQQRAHYVVKVTKAMHDGVKLTIIANIAAAYFSHLAQTERLYLLQLVDDDLSQSLKIVREMYAHGISTYIEIDQAQSELSLIQAEETVVRKNLVLTQNALRYLINENPHPFIFRQTFHQVDSHHMVVDSLPLSVLEHRPDMVAARNELRASRAGIGVALSRFLPEFSLGLARGDIATTPNGSTLGEAIHFNQAIVSQPLLTLNSLGELQRARGVSKAAYYHYLNAVRKALREVDSDLAAHRYSTERLDKTIEAKHSIRGAYHLNRDLYRRGLKSYLELLYEKIKLDEINIVVNKHKIDQILTIVHLYEDMAVGYDYHPPQAVKRISRIAQIHEEIYEKILPAVLQDS